MLTKRHASRNAQPTASGRLTLLSPSLADLGGETRLDSRHGSSRAAAVAGNEVETVLSLGKVGVRRAARLAGHVFDDVAAEDVLDLLLLETTLDDEAAGTVDGARGTQFSKQELSYWMIVSDCTIEVE